MKTLSRAVRNPLVPALPSSGTNPIVNPHQRRNVMSQKIPPKNYWRQHGHTRVSVSVKPSPLAAGWGVGRVRLSPRPTDVRAEPLLWIRGAATTPRPFSSHAGPEILQSQILFIMRWMETRCVAFLPDKLLAFDFRKGNNSLWSYFFSSWVWLGFCSQHCLWITSIQNHRRDSWDMLGNTIICFLRERLIPLSCCMSVWWIWSYRQQSVSLAWRLEPGPPS